MKQILSIALLFITTFAVAQTTMKERSFTVYGTALKEPSEVIYKTDVTLSLDSSYYSENPCTTVEELESKYYAEIKKLNIDPSKFTKDDLAYAATGYRKGGTVLRFETKNRAEILKVANIKMAQVLPSYVQMKSIISEAEVKTLTEKALKDARKNAEILAEAAGEEIDTIYSIGANYSLGTDEYWRTPSADSEYFRLTVVYTLKN